VNSTGTSLAQIASVLMSSDVAAAPVPIGMVMTSFEPGGTERQMIELVRRLDCARWTVHVACFHARGAWFGRVAEAVESVAEFPVTSFRDPDVLRHVWSFARWCRANRLAVVHTTELYSNIFGLPGAALARVPVRIANRREVNPDKSVGQLALQRAGYAVAHKVVANSRAAADRLRLEHVPARKIVVIPNGLSADYTPERPPARPPRKVVVVANLRSEKGHDVLIDAAPAIVAQFPDATFEIVGAGPELDSLTARADSHGVRGAFTFLGHRDDVPARLAAADIFVLPSRSEAFPNAVIEAMAAGLPIVASNVGGIPELVTDRRTGLLAPAGDARALTDRIIALMADARLAASLGAAARIEAGRYSFDRMVASFDALYLSELMRRGILRVPSPRLATS
jgi:glycosyltransferase involved in cell wall biosynthesis